MKKKGALPLLLGGLLSVTGCSIVKGFEKDLAFEVVDGADVWLSGTINIFNNAVLPTAKEKEGVKFYRYCLGEEAFDKSKTAEAALYPDEGLIRYNDVLPYASNGKLKVTAVYLTPEEMPRSYLKIGWYDRSRTSKVDQSVIDRWAPDLQAFLTGYGATQEERDDVVIAPYGNGGAVADLGAAVNKDGLVDILLGVGNNVDSKTGANIEIVEKYNITLQNGESWRYIALLNERPQSRAVFDWIKTEAGHKGLTGE